MPLLSFLKIVLMAHPECFSLLLKLAEKTQGRNESSRNDPGPKRLGTESTQGRNDPLPRKTMMRLFLNDPHIRNLPEDSILDMRNN